MSKTALKVCLVVISVVAVFLVAVSGSSSNEIMLLKEDLATSEAKCKVVEANYVQVIEALNQMNTTESLPAGDMVASLIEAITEEGVIQYDVSIYFKFGPGTDESAEITINFTKGDRVPYLD